MRIAHCSDLHLLSLEGARILDFANKRWIGGMNLITNRGRHYHTAAFEDMVADFNASHVDQVICTGDITNLALEQEFRFARERFDRIALGPQNVTVLPGNHDAYVAEGATHFAAVFADHFTTDAGWAWTDPANAGVDDPADEGAAADPWPIVRVRGEVAIIGLSTSLETPWFTAYGVVGPRQLRRLRAVLADPRLAGKLRLVAIHHPPAGEPARSRIRGLRDRDAFAAVLAEVGAELVIHGHEHQDLYAELAGPRRGAAGAGTPGAGMPGAGMIEVRGVPSGTYEAHRPERTARYRVYDIQGGQIAGHWLRVWDSAAHRFVDDTAMSYHPVMAALI
jgi:3',5'-cyclic AMP phosphodiesterase CpdA